ncbi:hypothetical protein VNO77_44426 [Canavalia gladiata]|uniref:Uncharacterized protein n=1 Tax=Canavalia gladiata TaxID=3824 RepID=A0AAN9PR12_CANGL
MLMLPFCCGCPYRGTFHTRDALTLTLQSILLASTFSRAVIGLGHCITLPTKPKDINESIGRQLLRCAHQQRLEEDD